jgi:hypothetical protein
MFSAFIFFHGATAPSGPGPPHYRGFTFTPRHTILGRTPLNEWSARRSTHTHTPAEFFFVCPGFFPFDPFFCTVLNPVVLHVTLRSILPSLQQTQHKHPFPWWDFSNLQFQQARGSRHTPWTARPLRSAFRVDSTVTFSHLSLYSAWWWLRNN